MKHTKIFQKFAQKGNDTELRKLAIAGLDNDLESKDLLEEIVKDNSEDPSVRMTSANALHSLDSVFMNNLAAKIIAKPEKGDGIALFKSIKPSPNEVDFKTGLINMLTFTGNKNKLNKNSGLRIALTELVNTDSKSKSNFKGSLEISSFEKKASVSKSNISAIDYLASGLLKKLDINSER